MRPRLFLIFLSISLSFLVGGETLVARSEEPKPIYDPTKDVNTIEEWRKKMYERLRQESKATKENFKAIDDKALEAARKVEPRRQTVIDEIFKEAGIEKPKFTGTPPEKGRGILGDVDFESLSPRDYEKVLKAAKKLAYNIKRGGDYATFKELNVTIHRESSKYRSQRGSTAWELELARGYGKETALSYGETGSNNHIKTFDNLKKGGYTLNKEPSQMTPADWQELAKMTKRNMESGGINNPELKAKVDLLKQGYSPEAAGIVPDSATPAQREEALKKFHQEAKSVNKKAYKNTKAQAEAIEAKLKQNLEKAKKGGDTKKVKKTGEDLIDFKGEQAAAKESMVYNQGVDVISDMEGIPLKKTTMPDGSVTYTDPKTGETMSPSQAREKIIKPLKSEIAKTVKSPIEKPLKTGKPLTPLRVGGDFVLFGGAYLGGEEAIKKVLEEVTPDTSTIEFLGKVMVYGLAYTTGIPQAWELGKQTGDESMDWYIKELAEGKDPSLLWAKLRGAGWGVGYFIKGAAYDAPHELVKSTLLMGGEKVKQLITEFDNAAIQTEIQPEYAIEAARKLRKELLNLTQSINTELKSMEPLIHHADELDKSAATLRKLMADNNKLLIQLCNESKQFLQRLDASPDIGKVEQRLNAQIAEVSKEITSACRNADQTIADYKGKKITSQGVKFRIENAIRAPLDSAERSINSARKDMDILSAQRKNLQALFIKVKTAYEEAARHEVEVSELSLKTKAIARLLDKKAAEMTSFVSLFDDTRSRFITGAKFFYGKNKEHDETLREIIHQASLLNIDRKKIGDYGLRARALNALERELTILGQRKDEPCADLRMLASKMEKLDALYADLNARLENARGSLSKGHDCLASVTALQKDLEKATITIEPSELTGEPNKRYSFTAKVTSPPDKARYEWNFGDGTPVKRIENNTISHIYSKEGTFNITVRLYDTPTTGMFGEAKAKATITPKETAIEPEVKTLEKTIEKVGKEAPKPAPGHWAQTIDGIKKEPRVLECIRAELKRYESALEWFPKIRNKDSFSQWVCVGIFGYTPHSAQDWAPKHCCDEYEANKNKPGMWAESGHILQECGWREEIKKRKELLDKKIEECRKRHPSSNK